MADVVDLWARQGGRGLPSSPLRTPANAPVYSGTTTNPLAMMSLANSMANAAIENRRASALFDDASSASSLVSPGGFSADASAASAGRPSPTTPPRLPIGTSRASPQRDISHTSTNPLALLALSSASAASVLGDAAGPLASSSSGSLTDTPPASLVGNTRALGVMLHNIVPEAPGVEELVSPLTEMAPRLPSVAVKEAPPIVEEPRPLTREAVQQLPSVGGGGALVTRMLAAQQHPRLPSAFADKRVKRQSTLPVFVSSPTVETVAAGDGTPGSAVSATFKTNLRRSVRLHCGLACRVGIV